MESELVKAGIIAMIIVLLLEVSQHVSSWRHADYVGAGALFISWIWYVAKVRHFLCFQKEFYAVIAFPMRRTLIDKQEGEKHGLRVC